MFLNFRFSQIRLLIFLLLLGLVHILLIDIVAQVHDRINRELKELQRIFKVFNRLLYVEENFQNQ